MHALVINPVDHRIVYAATSSGGVFTSSDGGLSWHPFNQGLTNRRVNALAVASGGQALYAGTGGGGVFDYR